MINAKELEKLSPQERIKKLKEMEIAQKKEAQEIGHLIEKSMKEAQENAQTDKLAERIAPPIKQQDISSLFTDEEQKSKPKGRISLEEESRVSYFSQSAQSETQIANDYQRLSRMLSYDLMPGGMGENAQKEIKDIEYRMQKASYNIKSQSEEMGQMVSASKEALSRIRKYAGIDNNNRPF